MARDDLFRRTFAAGTAFLDMTRERAEAVVKDLVKAGEVQKGKTQKVIDELLERSRKGTEELRDLIRKEIVSQVAALGLATRADIERLEARFVGPTDASPAAAPVAAAEPEPPASSPSTPPAAEPADRPEAVLQTLPRKAAGIKKAGNRKTPPGAVVVPMPAAAPSNGGSRPPRAKKAPAGRAAAMAPAPGPKRSGTPAAPPAPTDRSPADGT